MRKPVTSMTKGFLLAIFALPISALAVQQSDYLPLRRAELGKPFGLKSIGELAPATAPKRVAIGFSGADLRTDDQDLTIEGRDKAGKRWLVRSGAIVSGLGGQMYVGDLDKNGSNDLVILTSTGGNGLAPTTHFISVMIDSSGRPTFFEADGYFEPGDNGFSDLVDMNADGKAELIYMNFDDGYWITTLYRASNGRWERVTGSFRGRRFPLYSRFTRRPNHRATTPMAGRHPFGPNLSNASPLLGGRLLSFKWQGPDDAEAIELTVKSARGTTVTCNPDTWHSSFAVVVDDETGREIASLGAPHAAFKSLLNEVVAKRYRVSLFGQRRFNECSPEILWASPSRGGK